MSDFFGAFRLRGGIGIVFGVGALEAAGFDGDCSKRGLNELSP